MTAEFDISSLLKSVLAAPQDDLPRLVYADALEERGNPGDLKEAQFIRVQCELASRRNDRDPACDHYKTSSRQKTAACPNCWKELRRKESELMPANVLSFPNTETFILLSITSGLHKVATLDILVKYERGFIAELEAPVVVLLKCAPRVCQQHPVEKIIIRDAWNHLRSSIHHWICSPSLGLIYGPNYYGVAPPEAFVNHDRSEDAVDALHEIVLREIRKRACEPEAQ